MGIKFKKFKKRDLGVKERSGRLHLDPETKNGILIVIFFILALISILSYFNSAGIFGQYFFKVFSKLFGWGYFLVPLSFITGGVAILKSLHKEFQLATLLGVFIFTLSLLGIFQLIGGQKWGGGVLGYIVSYPLTKAFGLWGALVILFGLFVIAVIVAFNIGLSKLSQFIWPRSEKEEAPEQINIEGIKMGSPTEKKEVSFFSKMGQAAKSALSRSRPRLEVRELTEERRSGVLEKDRKLSRGVSDEGKLQIGVASKENFRLPPFELLEADVGRPTSGDIKANVNIIKRTLANFGIDVEMGEVNVGPTVTQYTLRPAQGIKLSKITALQNDLSLALAAHPIRIEAPIPRRSLLGIEIPNKSVIKVRLQNLLMQPEFAKDHQLLAIALGRDVAGNCVFTDLERMPHLLIAGATGTGKTVCLNIIILSFLYRHGPDFLKFILIDPKRVEFPVFSDLPHLLTPVLVDAERTINALRWAVNEMERRFEILSKAGARDIFVYNSRYFTKDGPLPYIIIVIDELADLMASQGREVEAAIVRLAQMARAVGIHLVLATQRPSVEVITGLIKANITSRIAFQVASQVDSRTILDMAGAEKLLGNGDMLFMSAESAKPRRIQGTFISDKEIERVTNFLKSEARPEYNEEVVGGAGRKQPTIWGYNTEGIDDDLYQEAKRVVVEAGKASASLLQRRLRIGYARAARLLDILEDKGIVGPPDGAKPRQVYVQDERMRNIEDDMNQDF